MGLHISEDRLLELAIGEQSTSEEESHLENCEICLSRLIELIKRLDVS